MKIIDYPYLIRPDIYEKGEKKMIEAYLSKIGVPARLQVVNKFKFDDKYMKKIKFIVEQWMASNGDTRCIFVLGNESPLKEQLVVYLLTVCMLSSKTYDASYLVFPQDNASFDGRIMVLVNATLASANTRERYREMLYNKLLKSALIIVDCTSLEEFKSVYGAELFEYINKVGIGMEVDDEPVSMPVL